jgi:DNA-directed RNA polymerase specialized sigma24 family protein
MKEQLGTSAASDTGKWFSTTHWTVVLTARDEQSPLAAAALEKLCRSYWPPIYAFVRRRGYGPEQAQDLTQEFFARLLEKRYLDAADAAKGKCRTLLLTAVSRFLANERDRARAQKRGGDALHLSLEGELAEADYYVGPTDPATPETIFERRWAETILERVLTRLREEFEAAGQPERFAALKPFLAMDEEKISGADLAARLGVTESSAYSAVHRFRQRYGALLREEIAYTVASPAEVDEELRYLSRVLGR